MAWNARWWTGLVLAAATGSVLQVGAGRLGGTAEPDGASPMRVNKDENDPTLLINRLWLERLPRNERDMVMHMVAAQRDSESGGVFAVASQYRVLMELFSFKRTGRDRLVLTFPQDNKRAEVRVRTWACPDKAPKGMELCLEAVYHQTRWRLYSRKDWVVKPRQPLAPDAPAAAWLEGVRGKMGQTGGCGPDCQPGLPALLMTGDRPETLLETP